MEFYPFWNASRTILHRGNPYSNNVTVENQIAAYGGSSKSVGVENEQRFAYPVSALIPLLPLGMVSFPIANAIVFFLFVSITVLAVGWLRRAWTRTTAFYCLLTFSAYPIIYDLRSRQPTLLFFGLAVAGLALCRSGKLAAGAVMAALSVGKPQLGLSVILVVLDLVDCTLARAKAVCARPSWLFDRSALLNSGVQPRMDFGLVGYSSSLLAIQSAVADRLGIRKQGRIYRLRLPITDTDSVTLDEP